MDVSLAVQAIEILGAPASTDGQLQEIDAHEPAWALPSCVGVASRRTEGDKPSWEASKEASGGREEVAKGPSTKLVGADAEVDVDVVLGDSSAVIAVVVDIEGVDIGLVVDVASVDVVVDTVAGILVVALDLPVLASDNLRTFLAL